MAESGDAGSSDADGSDADTDPGDAGSGVGDADDTAGEADAAGADAGDADAAGADAGDTDAPDAGDVAAGGADAGGADGDAGDSAPTPERTGDDADDDSGGYRPPGAPRLLPDLADGVVRTLTGGVLLVLVFGPLVAGFLVPVGPPAYRVEVVAVTAVDGGPPVEEPSRTYGELDPDSRDLFEDLLRTPDNALSVRTGDPPWLLDGGERTVVRDGLAYRVAVERRGLRRFGAVLAGLLVATLTTALGAVASSWDPLGRP